MKKFIKKHIQGFTLIELIIVISIIGMLASLVIINYNSSRAKARDSKRKEDLSTYQSAVEAYFDDYNVYPNAITSYRAANILTGCQNPNINDCGTNVGNNANKTKYLHSFLLDDPLVTSFADDAEPTDYLWREVVKTHFRTNATTKAYVFFRYAYIGGGATYGGGSGGFVCKVDTNAFNYIISAGIETGSDQTSIKDGGWNAYRYEIGNAVSLTNKLCGDCGVLQNPSGSGTWGSREDNDCGVGQAPIE